MPVSTEPNNTVVKCTKCKNSWDGISEGVEKEFYDAQKRNPES